MWCPFSSPARARRMPRRWSASTRLLAYWVGSCSALSGRSVITRIKAWDRSVVTSAGWPWTGDHRGEEGCCGSHVALLRQEHIDDLSLLVNGSVDVSPGSVHLYVGLVDKPAATHAVTAGLGRLHQHRRESLNPPEQSHVIDLDASFSHDSLADPSGSRQVRVQCHSAHSRHPHVIVLEMALATSSDAHPPAGPLRL